MASIQGIYVALFGRPADPVGLAFFNGVTGNGADLTAIGDLTSTPEYQDRFAGKTSAEVITSIFQTLFNRNPELAGLTFFVTELAAGRQTLNSIAINILDGAQGTDLETVNNKITAADAFTAAIDQPDEIAGYTGNDAAEQGRLFLAPITNDVATIPDAAATDAAVAKAVSVGGPNVAEFVLTTGDDFADNNSAFRNGPLAPIESNFRFTVNDERVTASNLTILGLAVGDTLVDSSTTDNDRLNGTAAGNGSITAYSGVATVLGLESINLVATVASGVFNMGNYAGVKNVNLTGTLFQTGGAFDTIQFVNFAGSGVSNFDVSGLAAGAEVLLDAVAIQDGTANQAITVKGHAGRDFIVLGNGDNVIDAGTGFNQVQVGNGDNKITTGDLDDQVFVGNGDNEIATGNGTSNIGLGSGDNKVTTGTGVDNIFIAPGNGDNTISTGDGVDTVNAAGTADGNNTYTLGTGGDTLGLGGAGASVVNIAAGDTGNAVGSIDRIFTFNTGEDAIDYTALAAGDAAVNYVEGNSGAGFAAALLVANAQFGANPLPLLYAFITDGATAWLFTDADLNGAAESAVELAGLTNVNQFADSDII